MRTVALEEHFLPHDLARIGFPQGTPIGGIDAELDDVGEGRLALMDAAGVDVQVISLVGQGVQQLPAVEAVAVARDANDRAAAAVAAHPDRFAAFGVLPLSDPEASAVELRRCRDLGFVGVMIHGLTHGLFLDDPSMAPVLAAADELGVPVYLHPSPPPSPVRQAYYSGLEPAVATALATGAWGWHAECGLHVLRLVATGTFDRYPDLRLIVGHMGENLPFSLARAEWRLGFAVSGSRTVTQTVLDHVLITTSGYFTDPPLHCALEVFGPERILFAVDHPFSDSRRGTEFLATAAVDDATREAIAHGNAERLLGL